MRGFMERLTKYNQIMFSIISTALILGFIAFIIFLITEISSSTSYHSTDQIISNVEQKRLIEEIKGNT